MNKVYVVTILDYSNDVYVSSRTMGVFDSLEFIEQSLVLYSGHINENTGKYLVVESVERDSYIFSYEDPLIWYKYNYDKDVYEKCECPEEHKTTVGFWQ